MGEDPGTLEEVYEPFLIKEGFIKRTPRGREVTDLAYTHLGRSRVGEQGFYLIRQIDMAGGMKRLAKETAVYGLSSIVGRFLNWMLVPMYTRVLAEQGLWDRDEFIWLDSPVAGLAYLWHGDGFFRFINKKRSKSRCGCMLPCCIACWEVRRCLA